MKRLVVLGSLNEDLVVAGVPLPRPGETVAGGRFEQHHGGKGGNAAVAAARALRGGPLEGRVAFIGAVGADDHGRAAMVALRDEGIDVDAVAVLPDAPTGVALIVVAADGENQIAVASGANGRLEARAVEASIRTLLRDGGVLLASLEVPADTVLAGARAARAAGATVIIDPAPADAFPPALADEADVLTPNEGELAALGGAEIVARGATEPAPRGHPWRRRGAPPGAGQRSAAAAAPGARRGRRDRRRRHLQRRPRRGPARGPRLGRRVPPRGGRGRPLGHRGGRPRGHARSRRHRRGHGRGRLRKRRHAPRYGFTRA